MRDNKCISELLWEQVNLQPHKIAVVFDDKTLTYRQLADDSSDLAMYLHYQGAALDDCVGIYIEPSFELMIGVWGILMAGSAYLPLSPEYPEERLKYMIDDSRTKIIFTQDELKNKLSEIAPQNTHIFTFRDVKKFKEEKIKGIPLKLKAKVQPNNLAYIIYTSGSTGKPKGVMIEHHSIVNQMNWLKSEFNLNDKSIILQKTPMSFDAAQWEILAPSCGSKVIMGAPGIYKNVEQLIEVICKHNVTILQCVPTLLQALLDTDKFTNCKSLTQIFSGGEALTRQLALECIGILPQSNLINLYGPTECTINTSAFVVNPDALNDSPNVISIGAPINNMQYYILDSNLMPLSVGEIGELYISGAGLARGYLHRLELTAEKFIDNPFSKDVEKTKLYKTGDLACWNSDETVQYVGRADNQVKLRGFRIELDEIKSAIETHDWVKNSAVILKNDPYTGYENLLAFIELNPKEAALMDQGNHDPHHQSKESKAQVMMQISNKGCRDKISLENKEVINLPGMIPTAKQIKKVFARKTYRFFEGQKVTKENILRLLDDSINNNYLSKIEDFDYGDFGEILRYFGQYISEERLLPKYAYASPGALYATQMYLELNGIGGLCAGYYYYHPVHHQLFLIQAKKTSVNPEIKIHFVGKKNAIEPIYKNNIQEVFEIEAGHMLGLFEQVLSEYGLNIANPVYQVSIKNYLQVAEEDYYLGSFQIISGKKQSLEDLVDLYVQAHPGKISDLKAGLYHYKNNDLQKVSDEIVLRKHVIAINQEVYNRSSFGISIISKTDKDWMAYINLGRKLQKLQMNTVKMGFMSSGYSSKTGNDLPSAKRIEEILGGKLGASYFCVSGGVSDKQIDSHGMNEDIVHMKGPAEMIKDDLKNSLPYYMVPNKVIVLNKMPLTVNGKIDFNELKKQNVELTRREYIPPRTELEQKICAIWKKEIKREDISVNENFFELGGNSLIAVSLVNEINKEMNFSLPLQVLFECPTIAMLARQVIARETDAYSRLIPLKPKGSKKPIYCWPGLGGCCMSLRSLSTKITSDQPFYGIQAYGVNKDEIPYETLQEMAAADIKMIKKLQPTGPYTLWGYSFGARVAFEAAYQLEQSGEVVENLFLIAPGAPKIQKQEISDDVHQSTYNNKTYLTILFSVFMRCISGEMLEECLQVVTNEWDFIKYISDRNNMLDPELIKRIINIVAKTYEFKYSLAELKKRQLKTPIKVFKTNGDNSSFIESDGFSCSTCKIIDLKTDHYSILNDPYVEELVDAIKNVETLVKEKKSLRLLSIRLNKAGMKRRRNRSINNQDYSSRSFSKKNSYVTFKEMELNP